MNKQQFKGYVPAGKVFGNIYFVGTHQASTHLIDTGDGLILIDPGYPGDLWVVTDNITRLGFRVEDIKIILLSHGHYDHAGAAAELSKMTHARIYLGKEDLPLVNGTTDLHLSRDPLYNDTCSFTPDVLLEDGDHVILGNTDILCRSTPGHTDGTVSFFFTATDGVDTFRVGMHGGVGANTLTREFIRRHGNTDGRQKFRDGMATALSEKVELVLGNHTWNNNTEERLERVRKGEKNAFYDPSLWENLITSRLASLEKTEKMEACIDHILQEKIIVIVRGVPKESLLDFAEAAYRGGVRLIECTYDASGNIPDEETAEYIRMLAERFQGRMHIGAGTVLKESQIKLTAEAGGTFIISPDTNPDIIRATKKEKLVSIPGAFTPTEAVTAHNAGADFVKLFPINALGPKYLKDLTAPLSHIRFLAVGGVTPDNINEYAKSGAAGYGVGSTIVNKEWIRNGNFAAIEHSAKRYYDVLAQIENQ